MVALLPDDDLESDDQDDNIIQILSFMNIIPQLLDILVNIFQLTKDTSRENDAYKLIRYRADYRYMYKMIL